MRTHSGAILLQHSLDFSGLFWASLYLSGPPWASLGLPLRLLQREIPACAQSKWDHWAGGTQCVCELSEKIKPSENPSSATDAHPLQARRHRKRAVFRACARENDPQWRMACNGRIGRVALTNARSAPEASAARLPAPPPPPLLESLGQPHPSRARCRAEERRASCYGLSFAAVALPGRRCVVNSWNLK